MTSSVQASTMTPATTQRQHPTAALVTNATSTTETARPTAAALITQVTTALASSGADQDTISAARLTLARGHVFSAFHDVDISDPGARHLMDTLDDTARHVADHYQVADQDRTPCFTWCDPTKNLVPGMHESRVAELPAPDGMDSNVDTLATAVLYADDNEENGGPHLVVSCGDPAAFLNEAAADTWIARLEAFTAQVRTLRQQMTQESK